MAKSVTAVSPSPTKPDGPAPQPDPPVFTPARSHVLFVVSCITVLGVACIVCGTYLIMHNHESGGTLLISTGGSGTITGLIGLLSMAKSSPQQAQPTATATATADGAGGNDDKKKGN